ncbi:MAG: DsbA family protein [Janthinobacterium lividum]
MRILLPLFLLAALILPPPAAADSFTPAQRQEIVTVLRQALKQDPTILRDAMAAMQADEQQKQEKVTRDVIAMLGPRLIDPADPIAGNPFGDVTVIEFYDTRCPYCRRMMPVMGELLRADPNVRIVFKDMPVLGPNSQLESQALLAAQKQGGYFKLQQLIMAAGGTSTRDSLRELAERAGLDGARLARDIDEALIKTRLQANTQLAQQLGIDGTPAFIIGQRLIAGATDLPDLVRAVAEARANR